jgi:hypothetical protein
MVVPLLVPDGLAAGSGLSLGVVAGTGAAEPLSATGSWETADVALFARAEATATEPRPNPSTRPRMTNRSRYRRKKLSGSCGRSCGGCGGKPPGGVCRVDMMVAPQGGVRPKISINLRKSKQDERPVRGQTGRSPVDQPP